ncbi:hypothetical protein CDAR_264181 [Caerostris darwini]|uniref:Uncharacterized protein n=1 Tax=Caerostris darwini TaxID=1538125 RepID=A0AAV4X584_9ARAC|nr:hypothetical protein CDAR_264181 [Caerostris darwini]
MSSGEPRSDRSRNLICRVNPWAIWKRFSTRKIGLQQTKAAQTYKRRRRRRGAKKTLWRRKMSNLVATVMDGTARSADTQRTHSTRVNDAGRNEKISLFPFVTRRVVRSQQSEEPVPGKKSHKIATRKPLFR